MKKARKRSFRQFQYRECDSFAEYLEQQAATGWHFKDWRFGLLFEKGEPKKVTYEAVVFQESEDQDIRPEEEALEMAEYCERAGWKLVDGKRRYCIFEAIKENPKPIITEEEKFQNIKKAEFHRLYIPVMFLILAYISVSVFWDQLSDVLFSNAQIALIVLVIGIALYATVDGVSAVLWRRNVEKKLENHQKVFYHRKKWSLGIEYGWVALVCLIVIKMIDIVENGTTGFWQIFDQYYLFIPMVTLLIAKVIGGAFNYSTKSVVKFGTLGGFMLMMLGAIMLVITLIQNSDAVLGKQAEITPSLVPADFQLVEGKETVTGEQKSSIFGTKEDVYVEYDQSHNKMSYQFYHTKAEWMSDRIWKQRNKKGFVLSFSSNPYEEGILMIDQEKNDCKERWGAEEAWEYRLEGENPESYFEIRYPYDILIIHVMGKLDEKEVAIIREKLEVAEQ